MADQTERFEMRLTRDMLEAIDDYRRKQSDVPTRSEAIRRLVDLGLKSAKAGKRQT